MSRDPHDNHSRLPASIRRIFLYSGRDVIFGLRAAKDCKASAAFFFLSNRFKEMKVGRSLVRKLFHRQSKMTKKLTKLQQ